MSAGITRLVDTVGILGEYTELFPGVPREAWTPYERRYPELFDGASWSVPFTAFVVRTGSSLILVDAGVGPPGGGFLPDAKGLLPESLEEESVAPADVDLVFLTHVHVDHVGWITTPVGEPTFPNATYVTHERGRAWAATVDDDRSRAIARLEAVGALELLSGEAQIADGVRAFETPGHAHGHMSLELTLAGSTAFLAGDVAVHPAQLDHPDWVYLYERDPELAERTRRSFLERTSGEVVLYAHIPPLANGTSIAT
jgi:glyoxylase-like metal-dependent hydrolase (beta-lactamase superfamily II)